jgi:AraC family L-rhamnose operon transcriptional activator RhaR/AraC family L-rhamnose operon regulatory protein RhaS
MARRAPKAVKFEKELVFTDRNFPLAVFILDDHPDYPQHVHDFSEIVIISHGRGVNVVGNEEFPLKAGDVFVHHGGRAHGYRDTVNLGLINVIYEPSLLQKVRFDVAGLPGYQSLFVVEPAMRREGQFERHLTLGIRELARARELAEAMEKELYGDAPRVRPMRFEERHRGVPAKGLRKDATGHRFMAVAHFMALVGLLARAYNTEPTVDSERIMKIGRAIAYMESNFEQDLKLPELAKMVGMSDRNFYRFFSRVKNESPLAYLQRLRIHKGAKILQAKDVSVTEAAFACGFNDSSYFARQFRRVLGVSPRQFMDGRRVRGEAGEL